MGSSRRTAIHPLGLGVIGFLIFGGMFLLPLFGAWLAAREPLSSYFGFPPETLHDYPLFDPWVAGVIALLSLAVTAVLLFPKAFGFAPTQPERLRAMIASIRPAGQRHTPAWGKVGLVLLVISWALAWTDHEALAMVRPYTFTPLWLGYILTMDGLVHRRKGQSMVSRSPAAFVALFPASAVLWWIFEYVNRFVKNWYYEGDPRGPLLYAVVGSLCFSTVLPALFETAEWLGSFEWLNRRFASGPKWRSVERASHGLCAIGILGFIGVGLYPEYLFGFAWLGPLLVVSPFIHKLTPERSFMTRLAHGDWREVVALLLSAPICGFFWEMWNFFSYPKWIYQVPYVSLAHIFEMPALGYYGYVPFGLQSLLLFRLWQIMIGSRGDSLAFLPDAKAEPSQTGAELAPALTAAR